MRAIFRDYQQAPADGSLWVALQMAAIGWQRLIFTGDHFGTAGQALVDARPRRRVASGQFAFKPGIAATGEDMQCFHDRHDVSQPCEWSVGPEPAGRERSLAFAPTMKTGRIRTVV